jgi:hypothetical protein
MTTKISKTTKEEIKNAVREAVNGKIDKLRENMDIANKLQNEKIDTLMQTFNETTAFFKVCVKIAQFIIPIGAAFGIIYGLIKWLKES